MILIMNYEGLHKMERDAEYKTEMLTLMNIQIYKHVSEM